MENTQQELLKNKRVVEEINRHLWIESEKAGYDIGFENAAQDWLERFSQTWMEYHLPQKTTETAPSVKAKKSTTKASTSTRKPRSRKAKT